METVLTAEYLYIQIDVKLQILDVELQMQDCKQESCGEEVEWWMEWSLGERRGMLRLNDGVTGLAAACGHTAQQPDTHQCLKFTEHTFSPCSCGENFLF